MTREELIGRVADDSGLSRDVVGRALQGVLKIVEEEIRDGGEVKLHRFGKFYRKHFKSRRIHNPNTGRPGISREHFDLAFSPSKNLEDL